MDLALDKLRTIHMVLVSDDQWWLDVLDGAIHDLNLVRDELQAVSIQREHMSGVDFPHQKGRVCKLPTLKW
jgi:hypothetical protein